MNDTKKLTTSGHFEATGQPAPSEHMAFSDQASLSQRCTRI